MRYGSPSIRQSLQELISENIDELILVPLYPQFAQATTGSSLNKAYEEIRKLDYKGKIRTTGEFFDHPDFIESWIDNLSLKINKVDHWLFSFHGLPVKQIKSTSGCMADMNCCATADMSARRCYRAQCYKTAETLSSRLNLNKSDWSVSFQSRLGPVKWLEPYTDHTLEKLAKAGVKNLAICAPAFVVDGLETLEEINIEGTHIFKKHGGENLHYVECLNDSDLWVKRFAKMLNHI